MKANTAASRRRSTIVPLLSYLPFALIGPCPTHAQAPPLSALAKMPVKEVTVFKDGHAVVLHEGRMPTDSAGNVQMDYLPTPVMGTFWPYSADRSVKLSAVRASPRRVQVTRTGLTLLELLQANPGAQVVVTEIDGKSYSAQILGFPTRSTEELDSTNPPNTPPGLPERGSVILLKTADGIAVKPIERIRGVAFKGAYNAKVTNEEFRNLLTLKLEWPNRQPAKTADVGMLYLQKGLRWIPSYRVSFDGRGSATIKMQATLINDLVDLNDVTLNLVIGVPSFLFKDTPDPIGMQQAFAQLGQYFQADTRSGFGFSNSIMGQAAGPGGFAGGGGFGGRAAAGQAPPAEAGPELSGAEKNEDLFVFTIRHVTVKRGERMVTPVSEVTLKYSDVYTVEIPFGPPGEIRGSLSSDQQAELARMMGAPKVMHKLRMENTSAFPLTTAPALLLNGEKVVSQSMMTYTSVGGTLDLPLTTAVDVKVKKSEHETGRTPNAQEWRGTRLARIDLAGAIHLDNFRGSPVDVEVTRFVLGNADSIDHDGKITALNSYEDGSIVAPDDLPAWWRWYSWPWWWWHFNGMAKLDWKVRLEPKATIDLGYSWHYFVE